MIARKIPGRIIESSFAVGGSVDRHIWKMLHETFHSIYVVVMGVGNEECFYM